MTSRYTCRRFLLNGRYAIDGKIRQAEDTLKRSIKKLFIIFFNIKLARGNSEISWPQWKENDVNRHFKADKKEQGHST